MVPSIVQLHHPLPIRPLTGSWCVHARSHGRGPHRRTLARIAHEIVERNRGIEELALVGIRTRGVPIARRLAQAIGEHQRARRCRPASLDITLYRDDLMRHAVGPQPVVRRTEIPFSIDDKRILLVDDVLYTGRTIRAALDALIDFGRPQVDPARRARRSRPPRAADQGRLRRQEPADVAVAERPGAPDGDRRPRRSRESTERRMREGPARHRRSRRRDEIYLILDTAEAMREIGAASDQEGADAARQDGRQPLLRAEHADADVVRDRREAPERRHPEHRRRGVERAQGRDAGRHGAEHRSDGARHDRHAPRVLRRAAICSRGICQSRDHQRRRRHARASDAGAARRVHDPRAQEAHRGAEGRHRRRPAAQPRAAIERAAADQARRRRLAVRSADAGAGRASSGSACRSRPRSTKRSPAPTSS